MKWPRGASAFSSSPRGSRLLDGRSRSSTIICGRRRPRHQCEPAAGKSTTGAMVYGSLFSVSLRHPRRVPATSLRHPRRCGKKVIPFAPNGANLPSMSKPKPQVAANLEKAGPPGRSALSQWLRKDYVHLAKTLNGPYPNWVKLAAEAEQAGQVGTNGKAQSPGALRKMWLRVRREMEQAEADRLAKRAARTPPNRSPQQTAGRHEVAPATHRASTPVRAPEPGHHPPQARSLPGSAPRPQTPAPKSKLRLEDLPPEARAEFEKLDRGLAEFDRKRFG